MPKPKTKVEVFTIAPTLGAAALLCRVAPEGYQFYKLVRKGTKATVTYIETTQEELPEESNADAMARTALDHCRASQKGTGLRKRGRTDDDQS